MRKIFFFVFILISFFSVAQRTSLGFYYGSSLGYSPIYDHNALQNYEQTQGLLNINYNEELSSWNNLLTMNDGNLANSELINGKVFGIRANFIIIPGISIQSELEYEELDFNHIVCQNGSASFNNLNIGLSGIDNNGQYKIANYFWRVNYLNFPFVFKLYPTNNFFLQLGCKFGYAVKAQESRTVAEYNNENEYTFYQNVPAETVVYDLFDANFEIDNHGFDRDEWPFNWNTALIAGFGYETKSLYFSLRYSMGILNFFRELPEKDGDFFDNYNIDVDYQTYNNFDISSEILNNNFKLHTIHLSIGYHISN